MRVAALLAGAVALAGPSTTVLALGRSLPWSPRTADAGLVAAAPPVPLPAADGPYAFLLTTDTRAPVRWDPCRPIPLVVNFAGAPPDADDILSAALDATSQATGLRFVVEGGTGEAPTPDRAAHQPDRYGDRWAPVLVAWASESEYPDLAGDRVGISAPVAVDPPGAPTMRYVTGSVVIEAGWFETLSSTDLGRRQAVAVLQHELGHLVGLDHVDDPLQLMSPVYRSVPDWSAGDLAGLAVAGSAPCQDPYGP